MKTKYILMFTVLACLALAGCNRWNDCSEERANNYGRLGRPPRLYSTEHLLLSDFTQQYWQLVDGDTLRLEVYLRQYLRQNGNDEDGYFLYLYGTPPDSGQNTKNSIPASDYLSGRKCIIVSPRDSVSPYNKKEIKRDVPYMTEDCYDTLKNRLCKVEGIIRFVHVGNVEICEEEVYLFIPDWDSQLNQILTQ
ncbi:MAG: hypothetical protein IK010_01630 [Bacteroidales bacterium]|nr:hypothetical protein [Bacteroidales bacterium]